MRQLSLHVNDREGQNTSGSRLSQLGDTCAEENRKLAKAFSSVLPVWELVPSSSRLGALAVTDALRLTGIQLNLRQHCCSEVRVCNTVKRKALPESHSPFSSDPHARICGDAAVASVPVRLLDFGIWRLSMSR